MNCSVEGGERRVKCGMGWMGDTLKVYHSHLIGQVQIEVWHDPPPYILWDPESADTIFAHHVGPGCYPEPDSVSLFKYIVNT